MKNILFAIEGFRSSNDENFSKIDNFAKEMLNLDYFRLIRVTFEVILKQKTATLFKIAYCIASFSVFEWFELS